MAILGFKSEAVATTEITKVLTTLATFGAATAGIGLEAGALAAVATQVVTMGVGWISTKKKNRNPYNARQRVYSEETHEIEAEENAISTAEEADKNRREVRREDEFVEAPDYIVQSSASYDSADDEFADAFVGGGGY